MSSSPPDRLQLPGRPDLLILFRSVPDPCDPRGGRHPLGVILAVGIRAVPADACLFAAVAKWVAKQSGEVFGALGGGAANRPTESTIRRAFPRLDANVLDRCSGCSCGPARAWKPAGG